MVPLRGDVMEDLREKRGLTRPEFAQRVGSSYSHIYNLETGRKKARRELAARIARELCVPVDQITSEEAA